MVFGLAPLLRFHSLSSPDCLPFSFVLRLNSILLSSEVTFYFGKSLIIEEES